MRHIDLSRRVRPSFGPLDPLRASSDHVACSVLVRRFDAFLSPSRLLAFPHSERGVDVRDP